MGSGALENAISVPLMFLGWQARFYVDNTVSREHVAQLENAGAQVIHVDDSMASWGESRRMWRFMALADPDVEYVMVWFARAGVPAGGIDSLSADSRLRFACVGPRGRSRQ